MTADRVILAIDDDIDICELISATAEAKGLRCIATTDVAVFLDSITPDTSLIMLDLKMPGVDGIELLRQLGDQHCKAGIVLMSGVGKRIMETAQELAHAHGLTMVGQLLKPFRVHQLEELFDRQSKEIVSSVPIPLAGIPMRNEDFRNAIQRNEFVVYYQPQIDIARGTVVGLEALARWQHPKLGLIFPGQFIKRFEELALIDQLGWIVAERAMSEVGGFADRNGITPLLSINVSASSLSDLRFPDTMAALIARHRLPPERIILEITETALIEDLTHTLDVLTRLRMKQVQLSIDDFGTGYATMHQMRVIPATELKIDQSFVQGINSREGDRILVQKTIEIGHDLGMNVVGEGVETDDQLNFLRANGCDTAQGYLFSRPLPCAEMLQWVGNRRASITADGQ